MIAYNKIVKSVPQDQQANQLECVHVCVWLGEVRKGGFSLFSVKYSMSTDLARSIPSTRKTQSWLQQEERGNS